MDALIISNLLLWGLVLALACVVVALTRQIGLLHERIAPAGALAVARGPEVGDAAPELHVQTIAGTPLALGGRESSGRRTLLFFLSPTCPVCETLLPTLRRIEAAEAPRLRVVYASDGDSAEHRRFLAEKGLARESYVLSPELGHRYEVAKLPFAALIDVEGILRAKGLVNTREHLESLFEAERLEVASVQDFLHGESAAEEASLPVVQERGAA